MVTAYKKHIFIEIFKAEDKALLEDMSGQYNGTPWEKFQCSI